MNNNKRHDLPRHITPFHYAYSDSDSDKDSDLVEWLLFLSLPISMVVAAIYVYIFNG